MRLRGRFFVMIAVMTSGAGMVWLAANAGSVSVAQEAGDGGAGRQVRARVVSSLGRRIGASFVLVAGEPPRILGIGRTDAEGEIDVHVELRPTDAEVAILCESVRWIGNGLDEVRSRRVRSRAAAAVEFVPTVKGRTVAGWDSTHLSGRALEELAGCPPGSSRIVRRDTPPVSIEIEQIAGRRAVPSTGEAVDFGEMRFAVYRAHCEIEVVVQGADDATPELYLGGYDGSPERPGGNLMYPHFAMSQRGNRVRVLLDRAAARLVCHSVEALPRLQATDDIYAPMRIEMSKEMYEQIGDERVILRATVTLPTKLTEPGRGAHEFKWVPSEPGLWWFMEPGLR